MGKQPKGEEVHDHAVYRFCLHDDLCGNYRGLEQATDAALQDTRLTDR